MKQKLSIVKIGGNVIEDKKELGRFLKFLSELDGPKMLVHGGGKLASELCTKLGIEPKMVGGRRITDAKTLEVITMVYAGLTNKTIVAQLQGYNCNAIGLSGADGNAVQAHKRPIKEIDYGYAGDIDGVNTGLLEHFLTLGLTPVFCAMSHDGKGQLLNTNADTIASEIVIGMSSLYDTTLYYCFEKNGVLMDVADENSVIKHIDLSTYKKLLEDKVIADGMLPKMENCFHALKNGVAKVCLGSTSMINTKNPSSKESSLYTTITL